MTKKTVIRFIPLLFILFFFAINVFKVVTKPTPFYDWDEAIYAQVGREMMTRHSLVPLWQGANWLDKPPFMPFLYGSVISIFNFTSPEISARILNIILACIVLLLIYKLFRRLFQNDLATTAVLILTAFSPIFLQRVQSINIDIFILIGWLGYILFVDNPIISFFFLAIGVLGKSLIGFYPVCIIFVYHFFLFVRDKKHKKILISFCKTAMWQVAILSLWYIIMFFQFGKDFWQQHIIESHFRRVSASIESHFGKRTYYIDLLFTQFGLYTFVGIGGFFLVIFETVKKRLSPKLALFAFFLLPWFTFLNLTKTKIFWYLYPALPQIVFLILYPLTLLKRFSKIYTFVSVILVTFFLWFFIGKQDFFSGVYAQYDSTYYLAQAVKQECSSVAYLVPPDTRTTFATLESMGLLITTSKWWGNHPSLVYYSQKPVTFLYTLADAQIHILQLSSSNCIAIPTTDALKLPSTFVSIQQFDDMILYKKL